MRRFTRLSLALVLLASMYISGVRFLSQIILPTDTSSLWVTPRPDLQYREDTLQRVTRALSLTDPFSSDYATLHSRSLLATDRSGVREAVKRAMMVDAASPESWVVAGMAALKEGNVSEGIAHFQRATSLDPDRPFTRYEVGLALHDSLRSVPAGARELYRNLAELNLSMAVSSVPAFSADPRLCLALAEIRAEAGDKKNAIAWAREIPVQPPIDWITVIGRIAVCFSVGENPEAISTWKKARSFGISLTEAAQIRREARKYPSIPDVAYVLADLCTREGDLAPARARLEGLTKARPNVAEYRLALGDALRRLGRYDEAAVCYEKAMELSPANAEARNKVVEHYGRAGRRAPESLGTVPDRP